MKSEESSSSTIGVAILGVGMMGQEHISYMEKYPQIQIKYLSDPCPTSIEKAQSLISSNNKPQVVTEQQLMQQVHDIDLLVIATPNYLHAPQLLRWANHPICILVEKPVAISERQVLALRKASPHFRANIWVAMEYRYIPAVQKLYQLLPRIGTIKSITIRENRFPFLSKVDEWNKDVDKSGDTLVEKCCHFFDLFRLISGQDLNTETCSAKVHRGLLDHEYGYDVRTDDPFPIIDSAYVLLDFKDRVKDDIGFEKMMIPLKNGPSTPTTGSSTPPTKTLGCLELCMFAEGSRHQEEIIVTGMNGRLEAYLPENKVFCYERPESCHWVDRSQPPPRQSIKEEIIDCSDLSRVYSFANNIPQHAGHHYCSTAVEWKHLIDAVQSWKSGSEFKPQVSLEDGLAAVEMGMAAQKNVSNSSKEEQGGGHDGIKPLVAFSTKSCDQLINLAIGLKQMSIQVPPPPVVGTVATTKATHYGDDFNNFYEEEKGN